ncbi:peptide/nickel transport system ATP-binding protein [Sanguibacter gelidistatuariae]|uniref:Peptide/nickel transport system ATP-binding protein n=1 Tax=Sanguibacter gelidistatuariae TaxID=1814289 RepID=A0A1G6PR72_9MICO|nr:ABC transporter ATP-binding protein [Sanguibacter gelidistatuariae]SDC82673.1 peptide/nickel transport system ATP-binding protein [Sanguibacter gelidistatuariae]
MSHPAHESETAAAAPPLRATALPPTTDPVLQARGLTKHFPVGGMRSKSVVHAVDGIDLSLRGGQVIALVGESGSGKSTVARLLARLYPQTGGEVLLHDAPVTALRGRAFRAYCHRVQMIFQDPFASLNPAKSVRYTLTRSLRIHQPKLRGAKLEAALYALLERVQLQPERYVDKFPHELSGGQRQRVAIARALAADPEVLLADEPISMLDVSIRIGILNLLQDLRDRLGIAILYITHDIASARYFADETHVMYAGRIVESGDSESVTQQPAHPYTQLLVRSAPDPEHMGGNVTQGRGAEPPNMVRPPTGCRFNPRCPFATDICREQVPVLAELADGHRVACWGYADAEQAAAAGTDLSALPVLGENKVEVTS